MLFWVLKVLYIEGESPRPSPMCSIHKHPPHTSYRWRGDRDEDNQCMGMIKRPWWSEANVSGHRGYTPTLYEKCHGIYNDHRESGPRFNVSSEGQCFWQYYPRHYTGALGPTHTTGWAPPAGLTNTSSSRNLVFPGVSIQVLTSSTLLSFSGRSVLGCRGIWHTVCN